MPEIAVFDNRRGQKLFGTLHRASQVDEALPVIVLLSPGVKMRTGPHRLYNRMTDYLVELGYTVFKFDFFGLGDSEGELDRELLAEVYNDTENGAFVEDSEDALNWLQSNFGMERFILGGLCGGAITGLLLAARDRRVEGLISLGMTTTLATGDSRTRHATQGELESLRKGYLRRLLQPKSWLRLLTLQSDFRTMLKSFAQAFVKKQPGAAKPASKEATSSSAPEWISNANPLFAPAFFSMTNDHRPILLIFSGADRLYWDFDEKFAQPNAAKLDAVKHSVELHIVEHANHVFSFRKWEQEMLELSRLWLQIHFPVKAT